MMMSSFQEWRICPSTSSCPSTADPKRALVSNIGRTILKKMAVRFEGNEILGVDYFHMFECYRKTRVRKAEHSETRHNP